MTFHGFDVALRRISKMINIPPTGLTRKGKIPTEPFGDRAISLEPEPGLGEGRMILNFGPQHPATHGTLRLALELEGETIINAVPEIGFLHTGFEKLGESRNFNQFITVTDRMNYMSSMSNNVGFALAVEELLGIEVPPRAQMIRLIMSELSRISDHILCVGLQGMDLGAFTVMLWSFIQREKLYDIFELTSGGRLTTSYTRVGGLAFDLPDGIIPRIQTFLAKVPEILDEIEYMLSHNRIFIDRTQGVGVLTKENALHYGVTGPLARAAGVDYDLRRDRPYMGYQNFDFKVPVHQQGDAYARYNVRVEEMRESLKIVHQALDNLPTGPINCLGGKVRLPDKEDVYTKMESLIHHFVLSMPGHGHETPKGEIYHATESPNGELGWFIVGDGTSIPYRVRVRPPSFYNYSAIRTMLEDRPLADIVSTLGSLNVIAGELDR
jgi:NADH-quinone oxidoreductase subunit D